MSNSEFLVGSYLENDSEETSALFQLSCDVQTNETTLVSFHLPLKELTHFSKHKDHLYIANQIFSYKGTNDGALSHYRIESGSLSIVDEQSTLGTGTVYTCPSIDNHFLFISNYVEGNIVGYPILADASVSKPIWMNRNMGASINKDRQEGPHPHAIEASPSGKYFAVPDLGLDKVFLYELANENGILNLNEELTIKSEAGSGPRHVRFHPTNNNLLYVTHEMGAFISAYKLDNGSFKEIGKYSFTEQDNEEITGAEIHIHPSGKYLYATSRGNDLIHKYNLNEISGELVLEQSISSGGNTPLSFDISTNGYHLLVCNQHSNNVVLFLIDENSGQLSFISEQAILHPIMTCHS